MGTISHAFILILFIVTITSSITPNTNAHSSPPYTSSSPSPSPSPSRHPKPHHKPGTGHHHPHPHPHLPTSAPPPPPTKPVTPPPPPAKPPTTTYPTPALPPVKPPPTKPPTPTYPTPTSPSVKPPTPTKPTPASPPVKPPPTKPPTPTYPTPAAPPVKPPTTGGKRKYVAVQGMVYCKSNCTYSGINTLLGASPLPGAKVVMRCKNSQLLRKTAKTDKHGYYFLQAPPLITTFTAAKCKVYLAHKPKSGGPCTLASNLNGGASGAYLYSNNTGPPKPLPTFSLFTVGPFVYEPSKCHKY